MAPIVKHCCGALVASFCLSIPAGLAYAGIFVDDNPEPWQEGDVVFPGPPNPVSLVNFYVSASTPNTFWVDGASLTVADDGVVRYVLVVRSPSGAESTTFEGIRCGSAERRIYATGRSDGTWARARDSAWTRISFNSYNRAQAALAQDYFCDGVAPVADAAEARRRLKQGGRSSSGAY